MSLLDRERIQHLLEVLDAACAKEGITADVFLVGGAAMCLAYDADRSTRDLDGLFAPTTDLRNLIAEIGEREDLEPDWFNDAAKGFIIKDDPEATEYYRSPHLRVRVASPEYLLAMKLLSARESDVEDALLLARLSGRTSEQALLDTLTNHYPAGMLQVKNRYFAADIAGLLQQEASTAPTNGAVPAASADQERPSWPPGNPAFYSNAHGHQDGPQPELGPGY